MEPEEDFLTWKYFLVSTISEKGDFEALLDSFCRLLEDYLRDGSLKGDLSSFNDVFINETVIMVSKSILNSNRYTYNSSNTKTDSALLLVFKLVFLAFWSNNAQLFNSVLELLDRSYPYLSSYNSYDDFAEKIVSELMSSKEFDKLYLKFEDEEQKITLDDFFFIFSLFLKLDKLSHKHLVFGNLTSIINSALKYITSKFDPSSREIDTAKLKNMIKSLFDIFRFSNNIDDTIFDDLMVFAEKCMIAQYLENNLIGAYILSESEGSYYAPKAAFRRWSQTTNLADSLFTRDLHPTLLDQLKSVLKEIIRSDHLQAIWKAISGSHSSQKKSLLSIASSIFKSLMENEAKDFILTSVKEQTPSDSVSFLVNALESAQSSSVFDFMLRTIFQIIESHDVAPTPLEDMITYYTKDSTYVVLYSHVICLLAKRPSLSSVLRKIIKNSRNIIDNTFPQVILDQISLGLEKSIGLGLIIDYCYKFQVGVPVSLFYHVSQEGIDDITWEFLDGLIQKIGVMAINDEICSRINECLDNYDFILSSMSFAKFIRSYMLIVNYKKDKIKAKYYENIQAKCKTIPQQFKVEIFPLDLFDLVVNVFCQSKNECVSQELMKLFNEIFSESKKSCYTSMTTSILAIFNEQFGHSLVTASRMIELVFSFVTLTQKSNYIDYVIESHKSKSNPYSIRIFVETESSKFEMNVCRQDTPESLRFRIANKLGVSEYSIQMHLGNDDLIRHRYLSESSINEGSVINVTKSSYYNSSNEIHVFPCSLLAQKGFPSIVLSQSQKYDDFSLLRRIKSLINSLPDDENVLGILNDIPQYLERMQQNELTFVYMSEILYKSLNESLIRELSNNSFSSILSSFIVTHKSLRIGMSSLLLLLNEVFSPDKMNDFPNLIPVLLRVITEKSKRKKSSSYSFVLLKKLLIHDQDISRNTIRENSILFEEVIQSLTPNCLYDFKSLIRYLDTMWVFNLCIVHLDNPSAVDAPFIEVFAFLISQYQSLFDVKIIIKKCLDLLPLTSGNTFSALCQVLQSIFSTDFVLKESYKDIAEVLLPIVFESDSNDVLNAGFNLVSLFPHSNQFKQKIIEIYSVSTERWGYKPLDNSKSTIGMCGLRNLGATCYMNSVFQQLFNTQPFLYLLLTARFENEAHQKLQYLFSEMLLSKRKFCNTQGFCLTWKGWGKKIINPRDQQDASEFLQMVLDQLPSSLHHIFKGQYQSVIEGVTEEYQSFTNEDFYTVCLDIKGLKSINESFDSFMQSENFSGDRQYMAETLGHKIDAKKFTRILKAPMVLVIQLKRFEYDLTTFERIKINDRFEFPNQIDISPYMVEHGSPMLYKLTGVILHSGNGQGGHYISYVLQNGKWVCYNDAEISEIPDSQFESDTFGGKDAFDEFNSGSSANLLFYTRIGGFIEEQSKKIYFQEKMDLIPYLPKETVSQINSDNSMFMRLQALFSEASYQFAINIMFPELLPVFFFNVFCHSSITEKTDIVQTTFLSYLHNDEYIHPFVEYINLHFDSVQQIFNDCSIPEIVSVFQNVMSYVVEQGDIEDSYNFVIKLFEILKKLITVWRQIPMCSCIIYHFIKKNPKFSIQKGLDNSILNVLNLIYGSQRSSMYLQNVNLSFLVQSLQSMSENACSLDLSYILSQSQSIMASSEHSFIFIEYMRLLTDKKIIDFVSFLSIVLNSRKESDKDTATELVASSLMKAQDSDQINNIFDVIQSKKFSLLEIARLIYSYLRSDEANTRKCLIRFHKEILLKLLTTKENQTNIIAEHIVYRLFKYLPKSKDVPKKNIMTPNTMSSRKSCEKKSEFYACDFNDALDIQNCIVNYLSGFQSKIALFYQDNRQKNFIYEQDYIYASILRVILFFITYSNSYSQELLSQISMIYEFFSNEIITNDKHRTICLTIIFAFPPSYVSNQVLNLFNHTFMNHSYKEYYTLNDFLPFIPQLKFLSSSDFDQLISSEYMKKLIKHIISIYNEESINKVRQFFEIAFQFDTPEVYVFTQEFIENFVKNTGNNQRNPNELFYYIIDHSFNNLNPGLISKILTVILQWFNNLKGFHQSYRDQSFCEIKYPYIVIRRIINTPSVFPHINWNSNSQYIHGVIYPLSLKISKDYTSALFDLTKEMISQRETNRICKEIMKIISSMQLQNSSSIDNLSIIMYQCYSILNTAKYSTKFFNFFKQYNYGCSQLYYYIYCECIGNEAYVQGFIQKCIKYMNISSQWACPLVLKVLNQIDQETQTVIIQPVLKSRKHHSQEWKQFFQSKFKDL